MSEDAVLRELRESIDTTRLAEIDQRLADMAQPNGDPKWTVSRSMRGVPCYALYQRRYWAVVVAILDLDHAVAYLTAKPTAGEDPLKPSNALTRVDGDAVTCLKAATSHVYSSRPRKDLTPDHFDQADKALRSFVADVVARVGTA